MYTPRHLMNNYNLEPVSFVKGDGVWLWDDKDNRYLDSSAGLAVVNLGHSHPTVTEVIRDQAGKLIHTSNNSIIPQQKALAEKLCHLTGMDKVFFCNSGAEANEAAFKIARLYGRQLNYDHPLVVGMKGGFHGRTFAGISSVSTPLNQKWYAPLMPGFVQCPYNDIDALAELFEQYDEISAVVVEPILGEGGIYLPDSDYLQRLRTLCDRYQALLILDEIQTGIGRTGNWFVYQEKGILPDVLLTAKGLANGLPIGACLAKGEVAELFVPGSHGSTFGGNPLVTRVATSVLDVIEKHDYLKHVQIMGDYLTRELKTALANYSCVRQIRSKGLMIGIEIDRECPELRYKGLHKNILINVTQKHIIRLTPPLILQPDHADSIVNKLKMLLDEL